ncbi:glycosyltransferase family 9 protein [Rhodanobacter sp. DHG33]|uniref:glycosyltransferase family 9 protein n=1 Tax=Rhodanobacter sp. DHG33 TaxID=2775921 RepID=UPI0017868EF0|nr:glycosyltransferase family 9 protein [Rhodanobacter sp. DHG33]MBD8899529.1 glycosyltransferase family 9 protein [Rhodanobacter sp. DHG33]
MPNSPRPLVIRFGRLGDTVLLQPLLHKLQQRYGAPCDLFAIGGWPAELYADQPEVAEVSVLQSPRRPLLFSRERWRAIGWLRQRRDAPVYVCEPRPRALLRIQSTLQLAGVPAAHRAYLADTPLLENEHWVDHLLRFGDCTPPAFRGRCDDLVVDPGAAPQLRVDAAAQADCERWLHARGLHDRPLVLLQPANKRTLRWNGVRAVADDDKAWPLQQWAALAWTILETLPSARVLLCGCPREAGHLESIRAIADSEAVISVADELPLGRLKALLARAHSMVSVDTGPAHLAAALGCPLVVMFGGASPAHWAPRAAPGGVVTVLGGPPHSTRVDDCTVQQVADAWRNLLPLPTRMRWQAVA